MVVWTASSCTAYTRPPGWLHGRRHVEGPFHVSHDTTARPMGPSPFSARAGTPCERRRRGETARSESSPYRRARGWRRRPAVVWRQGWGRTVHPRPMTLLGQRPFARPSPRALRGYLLALRKILKFSPVFPCFPHHEKHRGRCPQKRLSPPPPPRSRPSSIRPAVVRARFRPRERRTWHQPGGTARSESSPYRAWKAKEVRWSGLRNRMGAAHCAAGTVPGGSRFCATIRSENVRKPTGKRKPLRISQSAPWGGGGAR